MAPYTPIGGTSFTICQQGYCYGVGTLDPIALNDTQVVVGTSSTFLTNPSVIVGFMRKNGVTTIINDGDPLATGTVPLGINSLNQIVGYSFPARYELLGHPLQAGDHGFLWDNGTFTVIDYPGATGTQLSGINKAGEIVGTYVASAPSYPHAFKYSKGVFTRLFPNSDSATDIAWAINDAGVIVGVAYLPNLPYAGFTMGADGSISAVPAPVDAIQWQRYGSGYFLGGVMPTGIANNGDIAGYYAYSGSQAHQFVLSGGTYHTFDVTGTGVIPGASSINNAEQIIGGDPGIGGGWVASCNAAAPATVSIAAGDGQAGVAGPEASLSSQLAVKVTTASGVPAMGASVSFAEPLTVGAGFVTFFPQDESAQTVEPDGWAVSGIVSPRTAGPAAVTARVAGLPPVQFNLYVESAQPASLKYVSGNAQVGKVNASLPQPLVVQVTASDGSPVLGVPVSFAVVSGSGILNPPVAATASDGTASTTLTLGNSPGNVVVIVSVAGLTAKVFFTASQASPIGPTISLVANAFHDLPTIAPNTWVEIKGTNLAPASDAPPGRIWQSSDFVNNQLPVELDGVSVMVNGKSAYVYFVSTTQVNVLTPPDALSGLVSVVLTMNGAPSNTYMVQAAPQSLSLFEFVSSANGQSYVYGRHTSDNSLIGPPGLFPSAPNLTTPVKPGESIYVAGNGFGPTDATIVSGALTQSGNLPQPFPVVKIGGIQASVSFAGLIAVGTYQINLTVPSNVPDGDLPLTATYDGLSIQPNLLITVQH